MSLPPPLPALGQLRADLDAGRSSSVDCVERALARAEALQPGLRAFVGLRAEAARAEAALSDARRARGELRGPLDGVPIAIKDNMVQSGEPTSCGSRMLEGFVSPYTATVVEKLEAAGAVVIGRTNMDEFAMGSSTEHSVIGATSNPWDVTRTPGGSSGGSAVAVVAGIVPVALGSDTGGSIRQPASCCGVVGMKPTYGRVSRWGLVAFASSLDQIGVFAHSAQDTAVVLQVISGHDARDSTSAPEPVPAWADALGGDASGLRIGLPKEYFVRDGVEPEVLARVEEAVTQLEAAGATVCEVSLPHTHAAVAAYYMLATAEASSNLARFDGVRYGHRADGVQTLDELYTRSRSEGFGSEVRRRILLGTYVLSAGYYDAYYRKAQQVRTLVRRDFEQAFRSCDVIVTPTSPEVAFSLGSRTDDPLRMYLSDVYTVSCSLAGLPGVSLPCGFADSLPVGLQLIGPPLEEGRLLQLADVYQRRTSFHEQVPPELGA